MLHFQEIQFIAAKPSVGLSFSHLSLLRSSQCCHEVLTRRKLSYLRSWPLNFISLYPRGRSGPSHGHLRRKLFPRTMILHGEPFSSSSAILTIYSDMSYDSIARLFAYFFKSPYTVLLADTLDFSEP